MSEKQKVATYCNDLLTNRKHLFEDALRFSKDGKVLYILSKELEELPVLSQDLSLVHKCYMKMISFLYVKTIDSLIESLTNLLNWQNIPQAIILDNLQEFCNQGQNACGLVAFLIDTAQSCSKISGLPCKLSISAPAVCVDEDYLRSLIDIYG